MRSNTAKAGAPTGSSGTRSRKNSAQESSPSRLSRSSVPAPGGARILSASSTPILPPAASDATTKTPVPQKSSVATDRSGDAPRWPISPRLRSPPPVLNRPSLAPPRKGDQEPPTISVQRSTPSPHPPLETAPSDGEIDDLHLQPGMRTPARGAGGSASTLETVQEASPLGSPHILSDALEQLDDSIVSDAPSQPDMVDVSPSSKTLRPPLSQNESGSESGSVKADRRSVASAPPPTLTSRQSSTSKAGGKGKAESTLQTMTVETETVTSIPQVSIAPPVATAPNGSLRRNPSSETVRPKKEKEKKKSSRKQATINPGTGEPWHLTLQASRLRHSRSIHSISSHPAGSHFSSTGPCGQGPQEEDPGSDARLAVRRARHFSFSRSHVNSFLTRTRVASSKADNFEAKVASAVDEADTSDSEETFVYDSNPPDSRDRPQRFHSRTPSATSMASQVDRTAAMRSIHSVMDGPGPTLGTKKNMKFVNTFSSGNDSGLGEDEGAGRSNPGSGRGTARHHHVTRWNRNVPSNGHPSILDNDAVFPANMVKSKLSGAGTANSRQSSGPPSPRFNSGRGTGNGKRNMHLSGYDMDETTGADDERTPLIPASMRSTRRRPRHPMSARALEQQSFRSRRPSIMNRFATCLVVTVMLMLVVSGAIGLMFATSQPLENIELVKTTSVIASEQELLFDIMVRARNPNIVVVTIDSATVEIFAKSPHAGSDSEYWRHPHGKEGMAESQDGDMFIPDDPPSDPPPGSKNSTLRLGSVSEIESPLSFEGAFFHNGLSASTSSVRLVRPANDTEHGSERWEKILEDDFTLMYKLTLTYGLPLSQRVRTVILNERVKVTPNSPNDPSLRPPPNSTEATILRTYTPPTRSRTRRTRTQPARKLALPLR